MPRIGVENMRKDDRMSDLQHKRSRLTDASQLAGPDDHGALATDERGAKPFAASAAETAKSETAVKSLASFRRWVSLMGLIVALTTAFSAPVGYLVMGYTQRSQALAFDAARAGDHLAGHVARESLWQQPSQALNLAELIGLPNSSDGPLLERIYDASGNLVASQGGTVPFPTLARVAPIVVGNQQIGQIEIEASLRGLLIEAGFVALFAFLLGWAVYFAVRVFPLRALRRAADDLEAANRAYNLVNIELEHQNKLLLQREQEVHTQNACIDAALNHMSQGLCMFDGQQNLVIANQRYARMYGLSPDLIKPGTPFLDIIKYRIANGVFAGRAPEDYIRERLAAVLEGKASTKIQQLADGRIVAISHRPVADGGWVATHDDITERRSIEARIAHMAHHDALTDLANRVLLRERMEEALKDLEPSKSLAMICLDLDRFKAINDTLGHPIGDELLKAVAKRLRACTRDTDTIARLGGDEFAILQVSEDQPRDAIRLAKRICQVISAPFQLQDHQVVVDTSVGISVAPADGDDSDQLLKNADLALYRAKSEGRGTYRLFETEMDERMKARRDLEIDLRRALANGEFELHYQPLVNLANNSISGFEALLRWHHPGRGTIPPREFIPIAEDIGVIVPLGEWVLRHACAEAATWPGDIKVAVNLSPVQFKSANLVQTVVSALANSGLAAHRLELEITESVLLHDNDMAIARLHQLRDLGVRISMDDFGTGYSSLSYLRSFPFDKIKIDRSFVSDLGNGDDALAIVRAVAGLASKLGIATTAEGVETEEQLERIRAEGCTEMQGYLFSPPRPARDITEMFMARMTVVGSAA